MVFGDIIFIMSFKGFGKFMKSMRRGIKRSINPHTRTRTHAQTHTHTRPYGELISQHFRENSAGDGAENARHL